MIPDRFFPALTRRAAAHGQRMTEIAREVSRHRPRGYARGFTLIEIMVVVVIIGLMAAVIVPSVMRRVDDAKVARVKSDIQGIETALTMYRLDNSKFPTGEQGLQALVTQPTDPSIKHWKAGGYLEHLNKDPWGNDYIYVYPGTHGKDYDLYSLGADGQPGGEGVDADIGNWNLGD